MNEEEQKLAIEGLSKFYLAYLITWAKKNPEEFAESYGKQMSENLMLKMDLGKVINRLGKIIAYIKENRLYDVNENCVNELLLEMVGENK